MPLDDESLVSFNPNPKIIPRVLQFYDRNAPTYETVLTPEDFEKGSKLTERQHFQGDANDAWDSDAMYSPEKFEGDIANEVRLWCRNASHIRCLVERIKRATVREGRSRGHQPRFQPPTECH